ncbi:DNA polymerase III subunit epsilon [Allorhizobium ampelinum]|nr:MULTISPECIES: 3'-5' exonuclease [Rhizobium/Agrobacterium group]OVE90479.1 DNA polymerase III subunit epsilon [Allorhizobium ampelinum]UJL80832.1 3'-5' exonuclease [Agrobacterium vitis]UJL86045.1 3'-5' exonuclease [Agrobacterium vitis]
MTRQDQADRTAQFDMFDDAAVVQETAAYSTSRARRVKRQPLEEAEMVAHLAASGRYRILHKLEPRRVAVSVGPECPLKGVIVDTETTGLNHRRDEIIEIGVIAFTFDEQGAIGDVTGVYGGLQQPESAIPEEITKITGITDEMVAGQLIDIPMLRSLIEPADLIIAHNASFDCPFCEAFSPVFSGKAWACSNAEIDWSERGYEGTKLRYLINQAGFFHNGHRAVDDCFALLEVLDRKGDADSSTPFADLYKASQRSRVRIFAENSPYDLKDHLRARGYRWSDGSEGGPKSWWVEVDETDLEDELHYLRREIYRYPEADPLTKVMTAFDRFRA